MKRRSKKPVPPAPAKEFYDNPRDLDPFFQAERESAILGALCRDGAVMLPSAVGHNMSYLPSHLKSLILSNFRLKPIDLLEDLSGFPSNGAFSALSTVDFSSVMADQDENLFVFQAKRPSLVTSSVTVLSHFLSLDSEKNTLLKESSPRFHYKVDYPSFVVDLRLFGLGHDSVVKNADERALDFLANVPNVKRDPFCLIPDWTTGSVSIHDNCYVTSVKFGLRPRFVLNMEPLKSFDFLSVKRSFDTFKVFVFTLITRTRMLTMHLNKNHPFYVSVVDLSPDSGI